MPSKPLVSVLIPCHNAERWIATAVRSALEQTWGELEVVVVDDGSQDRSYEILQSISENRLKLIRQGNSSASAARNRAFADSRGDYIQYLDADDALAPEKIERQMERLLAADSGKVASAAWGRFFADDPHEAVFRPEPCWRDADSVEWLVESWTGGGMMQPGAWIVPRAVAEAAGPWNEKLTLNDDGEYFCRVLLASSGVLHVPEARVYYRSGRPGSLSAAKSRAALESGLRVCELCERHLLKSEDSPRTRRAAACFFQVFAHSAYPMQPDLVERAEYHIARLGGCNLKPGGGRLMSLAVSCLGWKTARRLQHSYYRWRADVRHESGRRAT